MTEFKKAPGPGEAGSVPGALPAPAAGSGAGIGPGPGGVSATTPAPGTAREVGTRDAGTREAGTREAGAGLPGARAPGGAPSDRPPATLGEALAREAERFLARVEARQEAPDAAPRAPEVGGVPLPFALMGALAAASLVGWALVRIARWRARRRRGW